MRTDSRIEMVNTLLDQERGLVILEGDSVIVLRGADLARFRDRPGLHRDCEIVGPASEQADINTYSGDQCRACGSLPALICLICARQGRPDCPHVRRPAMYCDMCSMIYPAVAACVDEHEAAFMECREQAEESHGLNSADFVHMWAAGDAADEASPAELRVMAGFLHGWQTQSGAIWPLSEVE